MAIYNVESRYYLLRFVALHKSIIRTIKNIQWQENLKTKEKWALRLKPLPLKVALDLQGI
ncbi:MAG: hypothetical protein K2N75_00175 [Helicobacter sp.]|uniref:hypothetical protein n=1 Tax=Helicobacter sp. TaxID=218 RepID=UPI0023CC0920|nr:hypothetical protein [Helicobacter sp.]MDE7174460.1 hypothetical protein [Helicobacter sp.]